MASRTHTLRASLVVALPRVTRHVPRPLVLGVRPLVSTGLRLGLEGRLRAAMTAGLGRAPTPEQVHAYFDRVADQIAFSALIMRSGLRGSGLLSLWEPEPRGVEIVRGSLAGGKGAVIAVPHLIGTEVAAGAVAELVPITLLARRSPEPRYQAVKEKWYEALGVDVSWRPRRGASIEEVMSALRVLRRNRALAITPDLLPRPGTGVKVRLFGKEAELAPGPFFLAVRTGAPLVPVFFRHQGGRYHLHAADPLPVRGEDRDAAVSAMAQDWATLFEDWVTRYPETWQFWLDKRWSRWLLEPPAR